MTGIVCALHTDRPISPYAVRQLYDQIGWWPQRSLADIDAVLARDPAVGVWLGEALIGFARAVTDGKFRAYIEDVMVHPAYQRQGIGGLLLEQLLAALVHIETISLFCKPELAPWYEQHEFKLSASQRVLHHFN